MAGRVGGRADYLKQVEDEVVWRQEVDYVESAWKEYAVPRAGGGVQERVCDHWSA
jgi:hypothetical protein